MNADLHHQLHHHFDTLANELDPEVPESFDPHRPTTLTTHHRPDRRRPLLAVAAAITLITGTTLVLAQRHPNTPNTPGPGPGTTQPTPAVTTAPADETTPTTSDTPASVSPTLSTTPTDDGGFPPALTVPLPREVSLTGQVRFLPDGESVLVADMPAEFSFDPQQGVTDVGPGEFSSFVVDLASGEVVHEFPWGIGRHVISDDGTRFFDGLSLWDLTSGEEIGEEVGVNGFSSESMSTAFNHDGTLLAMLVEHLAGGLDLRLVDATDGSTRWHAEAAIAFESGAVPQVRFSDDDASIYVGNQIHDIGTGERLRGIAPSDTSPTDGFRNPDLVKTVDGRLEECLQGTLSCDISADGTRLVTLNPSNDGLDIWDIDQLPALPTPPAERGIAATHVFEVVDPSFIVRFLPDGEAFLVSNSNGNTEYIYDIATGNVLREFPGDSGEGTFAPKLFNADTTRYLDGESLFDLGTGDRLGQWQRLGAAGFSPDGRWLAIATLGGTMSLIDAIDGATMWEAAIEAQGVSTRLRFSDDGNQIYLPGQIFDTATGEWSLASPPLAQAPTGGFWDPALVEQLDAPFDTCEPFLPGPGFRCDITSDGSKIAMLANGVVLIWEVATTAGESTNTGDSPTGGLEPIDPEPSNGGASPTIAYRVADRPVSDMVFLLPDGQSFLLGDSEGGSPDRVYDLDTGDLLRTYDSRTGSVFAPKIFDPTGQRYFDGSQLWDTGTGEPIRGVGSPRWGAGFSTDGSKLAIVGLENRAEQAFPGAFIELIDTADGSLLWTSDLEGPAGDLQRPLSRVRFSDDDSELYVGDHILDTTTGEPRPGIAPPRSGPGFWDPTVFDTLGPVSSCDPLATQGASVTPNCAISIDGQRFAVIADGILRIWKVDQ